MMNQTSPLPNEDGYDLWLRYPLIDNAERLAEYRAAIQRIVFRADSPTLIVARDELLRGLRGLLGVEIPLVESSFEDNTFGAARIAPIPDLEIPPESPIWREGYFRAVNTVHHGMGISAPTDIGVLYGVFAFLRHLQMYRPLDELAIFSAPKIAHRILNHWDNLDGTIERG
ncbi:MAG: alpha-glucuronidase family glycosyl hydrolase, partial [Chloroflexota bacterium]